MDKQIKKQWVKALRSRKYKQGQNALCSVDGKGQEKFCCLGVLLDIAGGSLGGEWSKVNEDGHWVFSLGNVEETGALPDEFRKFLGISSDDQSTLVDMNDGTGCKSKKFYQIANWIERNL